MRGRQLFIIYFVEDALKARVPLHVSLILVDALLTASLTLALDIKTGYWAAGWAFMIAGFAMLGPARVTAATAAFSHDSVLVPTSSMTL